MAIDRSVLGLAPQVVPVSLLTILFLEQTLALVPVLKMGLEGETAITCHLGRLVGHSF